MNNTGSERERKIKVIEQYFKCVVEGNLMATHFEETTSKGILPVVGLFELTGEKVRFVRVFFDSVHPAA